MKQAKGKWTVVFERRARKAPAKPCASREIPSEPLPESTSAEDAESLIYQLVKRGIGPGMADDLVAGCPWADIRTMLELYDWYNQRGHSRGPGFLVGAIRNPEKIVLPKGFESSAAIQAKKQAEKNRIAAQRDFRTRRERAHAERQDARQRAFLAFWNALNPSEQEDFEREALESAEPTKRSGYLRAMGKSASPVFEQYRSIILRDHFERTHGLSGITPSPRHDSRG